MDEHSWFIHIRELWEKDLEQVIACVFKLPSSITSGKPEAYAPQLVAIGPYHYLKSNLHPMERYKVASAKRMHKGFNERIEFEKLIDVMMKLKPHMSVLYSEYLNLQPDTLAYLMVIDSLFVFELLCQFASGNFNVPQLVDLADPTVRNMVNQDGFIRDMLMVENQIPIVILYNILSFECENDEVCDLAFPHILLAFCKEISPLDIMHIDNPIQKALSYAHILDLLYHLIVHIELPFKEIKNIRKQPPQIHKTLSAAAKELNVEGAHDLKKPVDLVEKLSGLTSNMLNSSKIYEDKARSAQVSVAAGAASLSSVGVRFTVAGNINKIMFEPKTHILHLPIIKLDTRSDTLLRNLVAHEDVAKCGISIFRGYIGLMRGLVTCLDDVRCLRRNKIIESKTLTDMEVVEIFKGLSKSNQSTSEDTVYIKTAIQEMNDYYNGTCKVKTRKCLKMCGFVSSKVLISLGSVLFLLFMALQSLCSAYDCKKLILHAGTSYTFN